MKQTGKSAYAYRGLAAAALLSVMAVAACGAVPGQAEQPSGQSSKGSGSTDKGGATSSAPQSTPTPDPVSFKASVDDGAKGVKVSSIVSVAASNGTLSSVTLSSKQQTSSGKSQTVKVDGALDDAKTNWKADEALDPGVKYQLVMSGTNAQGTATTSKSSFTTQSLSLNEQTFPTVYPQKGAEVGVGMPVVLTFDVAVKDRANVEKHLSVNTSPKQTGTWHWLSSREVHYRPKTYWKPGTKVSVTGNLNGVSAGGGIYGQNSVSTNFTIGREQITKINLKTDVAKVYRGDKVVKTIYVSGGKPGWSSRSGIKLIMSRETNKRMTNEMIGAKEKYDLTAAYALRITNSGEFLHAAPWNAGNFGRANTSHGCTGMSTSDAGWLYQHSLIGDVTITTGTSKGMEEGNGWADWNQSWNEYKKGSAL